MSFLRAKATVIIPTFGQAKFARWAIQSVQRQTVGNIEICVVCDGSPENMVAFFRNLRRTDKRIKVFTNKKSPRTGEPYRDIAIRRTRGKIVCYCSHDDLFLPNHVETMMESLETSPFTHSLHAIVNPPEKIENENGILRHVYFADITDENTRARIMAGHNLFGLTFGAHTRRSYKKLEEKWVTTPRPDIPTDLYMWSKFISAYGDSCKTINKITALSFPAVERTNRTEEQRDEELKTYSDRIEDPAFLEHLARLLQLHRGLASKVPG